MPPEGINPIDPCDIVLWDLWQCFLRLNATRSAGFAALPITENEILAWCQNRRKRLSEWELGVLARLDQVAMKFLCRANSESDE